MLTGVVEEQQPLHRPIPVELPGSLHHTLRPVIQGQVGGQAAHAERRAGDTQLALQLFQRATSSSNEPGARRGASRR
ncbi:Hypothetical predicted protein [Podarcis lilfordi]|uniref:Uncharacterized protein n=1 Tax=Podarcis lilfordi TaxID=74358 RepID=A0AA35JR94_9SAUR|nr:Hypothetical predicted protein [Podarcis lilfordi]